MAQSLQALMRAIQDRLRADTTLTGLLGAGADGIHSDAPAPVADPPMTNFPMIVIEFNSGTPDDTFATRRDVIAFEIHLIAPKRSSSANYKGFTRIADMFDRVYGNWDATGGGGVPTFGLARRQEDFSGYTGASATTASVETFLYTGWSNNTDPDGANREWVMSFTVGNDKRSS